MPNGDLVTGASDGFVRVFSAAEERWASAEDLKAYDDRVASSALPAQQVGDVKKSDLSGEEALLQPGKLADVMYIPDGDGHAHGTHRKEGGGGEDDTEGGKRRSASGVCLYRVSRALWGLIDCMQWNSASMAWQKIGDVVDAVGSGRKQLYEGKEYDYVFDVDVQEGAPPLKLPYNASGGFPLPLESRTLWLIVWLFSREPVHGCATLPPE